MAITTTPIRRIEDSTTNILANLGEGQIALSSSGAYADNMFWKIGTDIFRMGGQGKFNGTSWSFEPLDAGTISAYNGFVGNGSLITDISAYNVLTDPAATGLTSTILNDALEELRLSIISLPVSATGLLHDNGSGVLSWSLINYADIQTMTGLSVLGRSANSTGVTAAITAGTDGHVLRRSGTTLGFGTIAGSSFGSQTANTVWAAPNGSAGVPTFRTLVASDIPSLASYLPLSAGVSAPLTGILYGTGFIGTTSGVLANDSGYVGIQTRENGVTTKTVQVGLFKSTGGELFGRFNLIDGGSSNGINFYSNRAEMSNQLTAPIYYASIVGNNPVFYAKNISNTNESLRIKANGYLEWNDPTGTGWDTNLYRISSNVLYSDDSFSIAGVFGVDNATSTEEVFNSFVTGSKTFKMEASGKMYWGAAAATNLYRSADGILKTDTNFHCSNMNVGFGSAANAYITYQSDSRRWDVGTGVISTGDDNFGISDVTGGRIPFRITTDGRIDLTTAVSTATALTFGGNTSVNLYRISGQTRLITDCNFTSKGGFSSDATVSTNAALTSFVTGDASLRFQIDAGGIMQWGAGTGAFDTNLYRPAGVANTLATDSSFQVWSTQHFYVGSTTTDGSWRVGQSGSNLVFQRRESGSWVTKSTISA